MESVQNRMLALRAWKQKMQEEAEAKANSEAALKAAAEKAEREKKLAECARLVKETQERLAAEKAAAKAEKEAAAAAKKEEEKAAKAAKEAAKKELLDAAHKEMAAAKVAKEGMPARPKAKRDAGAEDVPKRQRKPKA